MINKRRKIQSFDTIDLRKAEVDFKERIALKTNMQNKGSLLISDFFIKPTYGIGTIKELCLDHIKITISNYVLKKDMVVYKKSNEHFLQISFLLQGQKIIAINEVKDILYEGGESYLVTMDPFEGQSKIIGKKNFKEIKVRLSTFFLKQHGFNTSLGIKNGLNENGIVSITNELLVILRSFEEMEFKGVSESIYITAKVLELIALQVENYRTCNSLVGSNIAFKKLYTVRSIITNNLHKNFSMDSLSKEVGVSKSKLNKDFFSVFGCTVFQFSSLQKMEKAKALLKNENGSIYEIAEEIGYKNATHFSAAFKKIIGLTPRQYRLM